MCFILFISFLFFSVANTLPIASKVENNASITILSDDMKLNFSSLNYNINIMRNIPRIRVKRQGSGASKFTQASKMPQIKQLRLFLQMFKNFWDDAYIGGRHPFHHNVPKAVVSLYKQKIVEFFFPPVGEDKELAI